MEVIVETLKKYGRKMNISKLFSIASVCFGLTACSGSPEADDMKAALEQGWGSCTGVRFTDLKKTNGVDRGRNYEMALSFNLEVLKDQTADSAWRSDALCPSGMLDLLYAYRKSGQTGVRYGEPLKKGDLIKIADTYTMVKSEKGWIRE